MVARDQAGKPDALVTNMLGLLAFITHHVVTELSWTGAPGLEFDLLEDPSTCQVCCCRFAFESITLLQLGDDWSPDQSLTGAATGTAPAIPS